MSTGIEWTDETWNPTTGCTKISPGCANCYIERTPAFRMAGKKFVNGKIPLTIYPGRLDAPLHWKKPRMIFVNSMSDLFHEDVPDEFIDQVVAVMALSHWHTFQVLTKRAERLQRYFSEPNIGNRIYQQVSRWLDEGGDGFLGKHWDRVHDQAGADTNDGPGQYPWVQWRLPLDNAIIGVSVENKKHGLPRIEHLRRTPAAVRMLSIEPLLEDLGQLDLAGIGWVIVGGESGPGARPMNPDWVRPIRDQCTAAGTPLFFKQWGEWAGGTSFCRDDGIYVEAENGKVYHVDGNGVNMEWRDWDDTQYESSASVKVGKKAAGRLLDGLEWSEMPRAKEPVPS